MRGFLSFLIESLVPVTCVVCGRGVARESDAPPEICRSVASAPAFDPGGLSFEFAAGIRVSARVLCGECWKKMERAPVAGTLPGGRVPLVAPFYTNDALLSLVRFLKFSGGRSAAPPLAWWMVSALRARLGDRSSAGFKDTVLVPVPLHPRRLRERGYNQALLLARDIGKALDLPVVHNALVRSRNTKSQSKLANAERARNVSGAFELFRPDFATGGNIILVDDLVTTGETARSCLRALDGGGPASAIVLAAGRGRDSCLTGPKQCANIALTRFEPGSEKGGCSAQNK